MQLDKDMGHNSSDNTIEVRELVGWSVGHLVRNTSGDIISRIRVEGLRYIVHRRHRLLEMLVRVFHISMDQWIAGKQNTRHLSLIWMVIFVINLLLFSLTLDLIIAMLVLTWWISVV